MSARDISSEILESIRAIKQGEGRRIEVEEPEVRTVREKVGVSQIAFAALLGVSPRTLQDWEQGRRKRAVRPAPCFGSQANIQRSLPSRLSPPSSRHGLRGERRRGWEGGQLCLWDTPECPRRIARTPPFK